MTEIVLAQGINSNLLQQTNRHWCKRWYL